MKRLTSLLALMVLLVAWVTAPYSATSRQTRLYGTILTNDSTDATLDNAKVTITLAGNNYFYDSAFVIIPGQIVKYTDTAGYFFAVVYGVDSLFPSGFATYSIKIEHPALQISGVTATISGLAINADGDTTDIRDVLAQ